MDRDYCLRLRTDCVPGRPGCVLRHNSVFVTPVEERLRETENRATSEDLPPDGNEHR
jgi:hypothetical protein